MFSICMLLVVQISFIDAARPPGIIQQMFPRDHNYSCYSPSIKLNCTFLENPLNAYWTYLANGVAEEVRSVTPGHSYSMPNGVLLLTVNEARYSKDMYRCVAFYHDGETVDSEPFPFPHNVEGDDAPIHLLPFTQMQTSLRVQWTYKFQFCRKFTVKLNGNNVINCTNMSSLECVINGLDLGVEYSITVVATSDAQPVNVSQFITLEPAMGFCSLVHGICIWLPVVVILLLLLLALAIVIMCWSVFHRIKHKMAGATTKPEEWNDTGKLNSTKCAIISDDSSSTPSPGMV